MPRQRHLEDFDRALGDRGGPALQLSYAGPDGQFTTPVSGTRFQDAGQYMYHRYLVALRGAFADVPTEDIDIRVAAATGSSDTATPIDPLQRRLGESPSG